MEEKVLATENNEERDTRRERARRLLERKLRIARDPDGIIFMPLGRNFGRDVARTVISIDTLMNRIRLGAGFRFEIDEVKNTIKSVDQLTDKIWSIVKEFDPSFYKMDNLNHWRDINESKEEKETMARRHLSVAFLPKCEEVARLGMAVKLMQFIGTKYQRQAKLDTLQELIEKYREAGKEIKELQKKLLSMLGELENENENNNNSNNN